MAGHADPETPLAQAVDAARRALGLPETATRAEVNRRYRERVRRWHPDVCEEAPDTCRQRMRQLSRARRTLNSLIERYSYSLRPEDIRRDQEPPAVRHRRRFYETHFDAEHYPGTALTAEAVRRAADHLGLADTATRDELRAAYRRMVTKHHPDKQQSDRHPAAAERFARIQEAYELLCRFVDGYQYSFRPEDIRRDQENPLQDYERRFGDPFWSAS